MIDGYLVVAKKLREAGVSEGNPLFMILVSLDVRDVKCRTRHYIEFIDYTEEVGTAGLYFFIDFDEEISYVGMSKNVLKRLVGHEKLDGGVAQICFWLMPRKSLAEIQDVEAFTISRLQCVKNKMFNPDNRRLDKRIRRRVRVAAQLSKWLEESHG